MHKRQLVFMVMSNRQSLLTKELLMKLGVLVILILYQMFGPLGQNIIGEIHGIQIIGLQNVTLPTQRPMGLFTILQDSAHTGNLEALKSNIQILSLAQVKVLQLAQLKRAQLWNSIKILRFSVESRPTSNTQIIRCGVKQNGYLSLAMTMTQQV